MEHDDDDNDATARKHQYGQQEQYIDVWRYQRDGSRMMLLFTVETNHSTLVDSEHVTT